jgi:hypothetical protein
LSESVSQNILADLQRHFAESGAARENSGIVTSIREPLSIQHGPPLNLELPEVGNLSHRLAVNGSSTDSEGIGAYAAVTGNGRAVVGYFVCPTVNSQIAEVQAIRFGLRELDVDRAEVLMTNIAVAESLRNIAAGKPTMHIDSLADRNGIRDIARSARRIGIQVRRINSNCTGSLLPDHPLVRVASRLSLAACRLAVHGIPFDASTHEWLRKEGCNSGRRRCNLLCRCDDYILLRNHPT